jgi:hypothetical protein
MIAGTHKSAATPSLEERRRICPSCGRGRLDLIYERSHPILGVAGVICRTLKCNAVDCGALTSD